MRCTPHTSILINRDHAFQVTGVMSYHRAFPEIHVYGESPTDAITRLRNRLGLALESDLNSWERRNLEEAIAEI